MRIPATLATATGLASSAATLNEVQGNGCVSCGNGLAVTRGTPETEPDEKIELGDKRRAQLIYADGCRVAVASIGRAAANDFSPSLRRAALSSRATS